MFQSWDTNNNNKSNNNIWKHMRFDVFKIIEMMILKRNVTKLR